MTDETINRILDMIESFGPIVMAVVIISVVMCVIVFGIILWSFIKTNKSISKDWEDFDNLL